MSSEQDTQAAEKTSPFFDPAILERPGVVVTEIDKDSFLLCLPGNGGAIYRKFLSGWQVKVSVHATLGNAVATKTDQFELVWLTDTNGQTVEFWNAANFAALGRKEAVRQELYEDAAKLFEGNAA